MCEYRFWAIKSILFLKNQFIDRYWFIKWFSNINFHRSTYNPRLHLCSMIDTKLKSWFPVCTAHSREFVYDFCFVSCKMSQNLAFRIYLHEVNSKFHVSRHYRCEALCFILSDISLDENLQNCKNQWSYWKKNLKGLKDKVCGS